MMKSTGDKYISKKTVCIIFFVSIIVRCIFIFWNSTGYYIAPQWNLSKQYFKEGYGIAAGYGYVRGEGAAGEFLKNLYTRMNTESFRITSENAGSIPDEGKYPEMLHPPGMAVLIAFLNRVLGVRADLPVQLLGMFLDSIGAVIIFWIIRSFIDRDVGLMVGLAYAVFPPLAYASSVARLPEGLLSFFIIAYLASILKAVHSSGIYSILWYFTAAVSLGIGCYLRPDYMLLPVLMAFALWIYTRRFAYSIISMLCVQVLVITLLLPWAYRNHEISGRWIFTSSSVGATMITGLGEFDNPWGFGSLDSDRHQQAIAQGFVSAWDPEADQYFRKLFVQSIKENPIGFLKSIALRIPMVVLTPYDWGYNNPYRTKEFAEFRKDGKDRYQVLTNRTVYFFKAYWDRLLMGLVSLICFVGILIYFYSAPKNKKFILLLIISPHIYAILSHMVTHLEPRFLIPSTFCWLIGFAFLINKFSIFVRGYQRKAGQPINSTS